MARSYAKALDDALRPLGFDRMGDDWVRVRDDIWECVNRQSSNLSGVTVNLSAKDLVTEKLFLEIFSGEGAILMPPIQARIGEVIDSYDRWWTSEEPNGPKELVDAVLKHGLPWFDRVHTLEQQAECWFARRTALTSRGYHGLSLVGLALTLYRMGELQEAQEVVRKPIPKTAIPANVRWVAKVREWLDHAPAAGPSAEPRTPTE